MKKSIYFCILKWMSLYSLNGAFEHSVPPWLSALIPMMTKYNCMNLCFFPVYLGQSPWRWKLLWILKSTQCHFMGRVKWRVSAPFWSLFYVFDLLQHPSFNPSCASDMKKLWKLIHFRDESVLATVLSHRSASTGWTGIPVLPAGSNSWQNDTWKMLSLLLLIHICSR